jgi:hypothetical protein
MAKKHFLSDVDLNLNQILQSKLENLPSDPGIQSESRIYYNTVSKKIRYHNGTSWVGVDEGVYTHTDIDTHINDATKHRIIDDSGSSNTVLFSAAKILQLIADVNNTASGALIYKGAYDALTNTPNLETAASGIKQGWTYVVSVDGDFFSEEVHAGDMIIAKQNAPTSISHWTVINKNIPNIVQATETILGILRIATEAEALAGINDTTVITPKKLSKVLEGLSGIKKYTQLIGDGTSTSIAVTHSIGSVSVIPSIHRSIAPFDEVFTEIKITSDNIITFVFNSPPAINQYVVTIIG